VSYIGGSYLCGDLPTSETAVDGVSESQQQANFKAAYAYLTTLNPAQLSQVAAEANQRVANLPPSTRQYVRALARNTAQTDPRAATGLSGLEALATVASTLASLATVGLGIKGTMDQQKDAKRQAAAQRAQIKAETAATRAATQQAVAPAPTSSMNRFIIPAAIIGGGLALVAVVFAMRRRA
jgi:hypothetical protein